MISIVVTSLFPVQFLEIARQMLSGHEIVSLF